jgi:predicted dehydrogenase
VAYLTLQLPGGAIAHVHVNWLSPIKVRTTTVGGSNRTLVWDDLNPSQRISVYDRGVDLADPAELDADDRRHAMVSYRSGDMVAPALPEREALQGVMAEFADCIRTGRASVTDGRAGLRVLDILEAASRSLEFHGSVVPLRGER